MADYNLYGLNPRDFQHLVQAIARKRIASGVTAFGDGKDGARDLTYRGKMDYPSAEEAWDGYLVMGCKFQQRPTGDPQKDKTWALKQLEGDLKKFLDRRRGLKKPEYYIFVTNVALSGVADTGGRDRTASLFEKYSSKLKLKGYASWDYNDLRGFLDGDSDLRAAYGHFITAGDVLAHMMRILKLHQADFADVMHTFLQKELIADMSAKLQSAGEDPEVQIPLANVFVDLPFAKSAEAAVLASEDEEEQLPRAVNILLTAGSRVLRKTPDGDDNMATGEKLSDVKTPRFVIVGGPGQGKSTLGQYLCQLYRAAILQDRPLERLDEQVHKIIKQLTKDGELPLTRRFPIRIELKNFAHTLIKDPKLTLLEYIRQDVARLGNATVSVDDFKAWLSQYPWVLVLDGLDEVPPSSNRSDVLKEISSFRIDAASSNSDMLVVATTRPQSYSKEFSEDLFWHLYLTPLSPKQALHYGRKLAEARCGAEERRKDELVRSLEKACNNPSTSRLMQSPLQVTIMATLLEETGEPPQQRYRLFAEYYRTIYKRETRRKLLSGILSERQKDIDTIHAQAGLLLHATGEKSTAASKITQSEDVDSALSDDQFRILVQRRLDQIGIPPQKALELVGRISDSTLQRLVFLVRPKEGWVQFDITSFKEFMAAEAIMNESDERVIKRLKLIAPASYWRNVFQFAVGKCFVEREHLLDNLVSLCTALNEDKACAEIVGDDTAQRAAKEILWGSQLALDILADGTARQYPGYELQFARIALQLVRLANAEYSARLASVFHEDLQKLYFEVIEDRLGQSSLWSQLGAWNLLKSLADREVPRAIQMLEARWPTDIEAQTIIVFSGVFRYLDKWDIRKFDEVAPKIDSSYLSRLAEQIPRIDDSSFSPRLNSLFDLVFPRVGLIEVQNRSATAEINRVFYIRGCDYGKAVWEAVKTIDFQHKSWFPYFSGTRFSTDPSAKSLAVELRWLANHWESGVEFPTLPLPWPLAVCLNWAKSKGDLSRLAELAEQGCLGDEKDWRTAEQRWREFGIGDEDYFAMSNEKQPLRADFATVGFPFSVASWPVRAEVSIEPILSLLERLDQAGAPVSRSQIAYEALRAWLRQPKEQSVPSSRQIRHLLSMIVKGPDGMKEIYINLDSLLAVVPAGSLSDEWVELLVQLGREAKWIGSSKPHTDRAEELVHHFCSNPEGHQGLLRVLVELAEAGARLSLPQHVLNLAKSWGQKAEDDVLALSLTAENLSEPEIAAIADEIVKRDSLDNLIWTVFSIASSVSLKRSAQFALAMLNSLDETSEIKVRAARRARRALSEFLTNKPSLLQDPKVWNSLKLPERF